MKLRQLLSGVAQRHANRQETALFFRQAFRLLHFNKIEGDYAEFGCLQYRTFPMAWRAIQAQPIERELWGIGTFSSITEAQTAKDLHPRWQSDTPVISAAAFRRRCRWSRIPLKILHLIQADLSTLEESVAMPGTIALAWINGQPYSDISAVLHWLEPKLTVGMILAFEHYYCWSRFESSGARNAFRALQRLRPDLNFIEFRRFGLAGVAFLIEDA